MVKILIIIKKDQSNKNKDDYDDDDENNNDKNIYNLPGCQNMKASDVIACQIFEYRKSQ